MPRKIITLEQIYRENRQSLSLTLAAGAAGLAKKKVSESEPNRPGMVLSGFWDYFAPRRLQVLGRLEFRYLRRLSAAQRLRTIRRMLSYPVPAVFVGRGLKPFSELVAEAEKRDIPLLVSPVATNGLVSRLTRFLEEALAPEVRLHGTLVDVYGVGVLIQGESGVGKSECALELIRAGHRLVADDVVHVRKLTDKILMGSADPVIQYHMEIRGLGIINVEMVFGVRAVRRRKHIEILAELRPWEAGQAYDRTGLQARSRDILGVAIPHLLLPVRPGRNLSVILEVAAINYRMSLMGINPAEDFNRRAIEKIKPRKA